MECKYTCFDRVMHLVKELPEYKHKEAVELIKDYSFIEFLEFCAKNKCFTEPQLTTLYEGIVMWEDLEGNYWEEDRDKLHMLYEKVGLSEDIIEKYMEILEEEENE